MSQSAKAILLLPGHYVLQLRDNKPTIAAAGKWSLFGGHVEPNEEPMETIRREVREELSITPDPFRFLWSSDHCSEFEQTIIRIWFFEAHVDVVWTACQLTEGQAVQVFRFEQLAGLDIEPVMLEALQRYHRDSRWERRKKRTPIKTSSR